jgi:hypothetical protein
MTQVELLFIELMEDGRIILSESGYLYTRAKEAALTVALINIQRLFSLTIQGQNLLRYRMLVRVLLAYKKKLKRASAWSVAQIAMLLKQPKDGSDL